MPAVYQNNTQRTTTEGRIHGDERDLFHEALSDEQPVERVAVVERERGERSEVPQFDGEQGKPYVLRLR